MAEQLYREIILDHNRNPRKTGPWTPADFSYEEQTRFAAMRFVLTCVLTTEVIEISSSAMDGVVRSARHRHHSDPNGARQPMEDALAISKDDMLEELRYFPQSGSPEMRITRD